MMALLCGFLTTVLWLIDHTRFRVATVSATCMSKNFRVSHVTTGFLKSYSDVLAGIESCAMTWVEDGVTWRYLTPEEAIAARNGQAAKRAPLAYAEVPHVKVAIPAGAAWSSKLLALDAVAFAGGFYHPVSA